MSTNTNSTKTIRAVRNSGATERIKGGMIRKNVFFFQFNSVLKQIEMNTRCTQNEVCA